jgi:hypothetical protein
LVCSSGPGLEAIFRTGLPIKGILGSEDVDASSVDLKKLEQAAKEAGIELEFLQTNGH